MLDWLKETSENLKNFIMNNDTNAVLWICLFFGGIIIFALTYKALHKHD